MRVMVSRIKGKHNCLFGSLLRLTTKKLWKTNGAIESLCPEMFIQTHFYADGPNINRYGCFQKLVILLYAHFLKKK